MREKLLIVIAALAMIAGFEFGVIVRQRSETMPCISFTDGSVYCHKDGALRRLRASEFYVRIVK